jgi:superfamily II DNA or RNA helicase
MKVLKIQNLDSNNRVSVKVNKLKKSYLVGDVVKISNNLVIKVLNCDIKSNRIEGKRLQPSIYVWTTESYELNSKYKIGLVNWQSVNNRIEQTDTTGVLEKIELRAEFPLDVFDPKITEQIENEIHNRIGLSRKDKRREAVQADLKSVIIPTINQIIEEFKAKPITNFVLPSPKYFQYDASLIAKDYYKTNDRGWLQWTCASGKSWGSYWIYESVAKAIKFKNNFVVILVPNRQLVVQTHDDWNYIAKAYGNNVHSLKVGDVKDSVSDVGEIARWIGALTDNNLNLIVSTYQSSHLIGKALKMNNTSVDFLIYDEVHRLTGEDSKVWKNCLNNEMFPAIKRLAMTASPVEYTSSSIGFSGLENERAFGKCFHTYGFLDAQFDGSIAPLEILGISLPTNMVNYYKSFIKTNEKVINKFMLDYNIDISDEVGDVNIDEGNVIFFAQLHNTLMAIKNGSISHPVVYANSNARITRFMATLKAMAPDYGVRIDYTNIFSHKDKSIEARIKELKGPFAKSKVGVVGNVYCLQEGISINEIDSVILIDPRTSGPSIIQILGRPVRWDSKKSKVAKVYLPIIVKEEAGKMVFDKDYFKVTTDWILNITSANSDMKNIILPNGFDDKKRDGIDVRDIKPKNNKPSLSGKNFKTKASFQLSEIDWSDFKKSSEFKTIISTQKSKNIIISTKEGNDEMVYRNSKNFILDYQIKLEKAIETYNVKLLKKYGLLIKSEKAYIEEYSINNNINTKEAEAKLKSAGLDIVLNLAKTLKKKNIVNSFNLI